MHRSRRHLLGACLLLLACERGAKEDSDSTTKGPARILGATTAAAPLGQFAQTSFFRIRVHEQRACQVEDFLKPPAGTHRFGVEVTLEATGEQSVSANPFYATLETRDGDRFESTLAGCRPVLQAKQLKPGETVRGWLSFDIPDSAVPNRLRYEPQILGAGRQRALLALEP